MFSHFSKFDFAVKRSRLTQLIVLTISKYSTILCNIPTSNPKGIDAHIHSEKRSRHTHTVDRRNSFFSNRGQFSYANCKQQQYLFLLCFIIHYKTKQGASWTADIQRILLLITIDANIITRTVNNNKTTAFERSGIDYWRAQVIDYCRAQASLTASNPHPLFLHESFLINQ